MRGKITADKGCQQVFFLFLNMKISGGSSSWFSRMAEAALWVLEGDINEKPAISFAEAWRLELANSRGFYMLLAGFL